MSAHRKVRSTARDIGLRSLDFPAALGELEPQLWSDVELAFFERDLDRMAAYGGPLWQPIVRPLLQARAEADDRQDLGCKPAACSQTEFLPRGAR